MKRMYRYLICLFVLVMLTSCGSAGSPLATSQGSGVAPQNSANPVSADGDMSDLPEIEFTLFVPDADYRVSPEDAPVFEQLFEKTKVRIKKIVPPSDPIERLNIMLATDDLPDLIRFKRDVAGNLADVTMMRQYIETGKLLKLNDLLEEYAPNVMNTNFANFIDRLKDENGDIYYLPPEYTIGDPVWIEADRGFGIRTGYLEGKGWHEPKTLED